MRPGTYPCGDLTPHPEHQHDHGPDGYMYICTGRGGSDDPCFLDDVLDIINRADKGPLTASEKKAIELCRAAVGNALIDRLAGEQP